MLKHYIKYKTNVCKIIDNCFPLLYNLVAGAKKGKCKWIRKMK